MVTIFKRKNTEKECRLLPTMDPVQTARYRHFRTILDHNRQALTLTADLEQIYYDNRPFTLQHVERVCGSLIDELGGMVKALSLMTGKEYQHLYDLIGTIRRSILNEQGSDIRLSADSFILPLGRIEAGHAGIVGGKAANLALMHRKLALPTPNGFAVTTTASRLFLRETGLADEINDALAESATDDPAALEAAGRRIRSRIMETPLPISIRTAIREAAGSMVVKAPGGLRLAVRSSAIGEDGDISFAGQYASVLNVPIEKLSEAYKQVIAGKYSASALSYRLHHGLDDRETPMAVLIIEMVQPRLSGVLYTADPNSDECENIRISAVYGLGDALVSGDTSPQRFFRIAKKEFRVLEISGEETKAALSAGIASDEKFLRELWESARRLENHFQCPLDIEWALDAQDRLFLLQVRPLLIMKAEEEEDPQLSSDYSGHPVLLEGGKCAAGGVAVGKVVILKSGELSDSIQRIEPDSILVTRAASIAITPWVGKVKGIITDIGGIASHLASVAREFRVPALFDAKIATATLKDGDIITLWADRARVYQGVVEALARRIRPANRPIFASSAHVRLQYILDLISPLNLIDPSSAMFTPEGCSTLHDIIRFCHEISMREMFRFGQSTGRFQNAVQLKVTIPIQLFALDLGGGLHQGLTTCEEINAHDVASVPFRAIWRGLSHPGVNWSGTVAIGAHNFMTLMVGGAMPQQNDQLGGASYAIISDDYLNLSARFGYHFATVDALCGADTEHNYVKLHFAGGAGAYYGRSLRVQYMANVLTRLGFETTLKGDLIEASLPRVDQTTMEEALDQLGRLLGTSRLLDMAMKNPKQVEELTESFFQGKYDILELAPKDAPETYHLITGNWKKSAPDMESGVLQDGSDFGSWISANISQTMGRFMGKRYQELLDNIGAYYYFPLAIAKESNMGEGAAQVLIKPLSGNIDQAGGLAFAIRDWSNYFVFRINALEANAILFEFKNGRRLERLNIDTPVRAGEWHSLRVEMAGHRIRAMLGERLVMEYESERGLDGYVGLWTKADSVTLFKELILEKSKG